ncbi:hypothetical protein [Citrifermentans bremense]|uniref:hypothetical protein n=1 Tax=Citrifermentans bremense TaxID=60035 RepID=UPI000410CE34|nr:hypothetical protein [Citrifermentans bremense]
MKTTTPIAVYIHDIMIDTAAFLRRSLDVYWPTNVGSLNDLPERNLSAHFSHAVLMRNFHLFAEVNNQYKSEKELLDILCISPDKRYHLTCEFKTYTNGSMRRSVRDIDRVHTFPLNVDLSPEIFGSPFVNTLQQCHSRIGVIAGVLWRKSFESPSLNSTAQQAFARRVEELNGVITDEPILVREYRPGSGSPFSSWEGAYYLYYALVGDLHIEVDHMGNQVRGETASQNVSVFPQSSPPVTANVVHPIQKGNEPGFTVDATNVCNGASNCNPVGNAAFTIQGAVAAPKVSACSTRTSDDIPALLFHPNYRRRLTDAEEKRLAELDSKSDLNPSEKSEFASLRRIKGLSFSGAQPHSLFNKKVKTYRQGCFDDGKYLFYSPTFCNQKKGAGPPTTWVATYDQTGTPVWVCSGCLSVYPRKEK